MPFLKRNFSICSSAFTSVPKHPGRTFSLESLSSRRIPGIISINSREFCWILYRSHPAAILSSFIIETSQSRANNRWTSTPKSRAATLSYTRTPSLRNEKRTESLAKKVKKPGFLAATRSISRLSSQEWGVLHLSQSGWCSFWNISYQTIAMKPGKCVVIWVFRNGEFDLHFRFF